MPRAQDPLAALLSGFGKAHTVTCCCGASCDTDDLDLAKAFVEAHKTHTPRINL